MLFFRGCLLIVVLITLCSFKANSPVAPIGEEVSTEITSAEKELLFSSYSLTIYENLDLCDLEYEVFDYALRGYWRLQARERVENSRYLTIVDFSVSANTERLYIIDLEKHELVMKTYVAHGMGSGGEFAKDFSNEPNSGKSSLGFFLTGEPYRGRRGYSLKLDGQESTFNSKVRSRGVVIHEAEYATAEFIRKNGRLGRSQGCTAVPPEHNKFIVDLLQGKSVFFIYAKNRSYLRSSRFIKGTSHLDAFYESQMLNC